MKRFLPLVLICASMVALFSCEDSKIYVPTNADLPATASDYESAAIEDYVIDIDAEQTLDLIESGEHFVLYIGNSSCSSCLAFKPSLIEYIDKSRATVFHFDNLVFSNQYSLLPTNYPDYFTAEYPPTPSLYFFKDGLMTARRDGSTRMMTYNTFKPIMDGYMRVSKAKFSRYQNTLASTKDASGLLFFYDRTNAVENLAFVDIIYPKTMQSSSVLMIADLYFMAIPLEDQNQFKETFGLTDISGWLVKYTAGTVVDSFQLTLSEDPALTSWLNKYF